MKSTSTYQSSPVLVWLSLLVILLGNPWMANAASGGTPPRGGDTRDGPHRLPPISVPQMLQSSEVQLAAAQPGRLGVTEQPGRRSATEQQGRSGTDPDHATRKPTLASDPPRPIIVEALLNRQVSAPLMLDTGATYTVLTRQTAQDLGITAFERLPKQPFFTPGGRVLSPVTTLKSVRVGTAEARDVAVAIDVDGHLPLGLLGMTFLRHFKVSMDQAQGQVRFERR